MNADSTDTSLGQEWHDLLFGVRRSIRYHQRRLLFFDRLNKGIRFISLLSGVSVISTVLAKMGEPWILGSAAIVAILSTFDLVINTEGQIRRHMELASRFINLEKRMIVSKTPTPNLLAVIKTERLDIESGEPPILRVLDCICHNELLRAMGYPKDSEHYAKITWYQRLFAQLFDIRSHIIKTN